MQWSMASSDSIRPSGPKIIDPHEDPLVHLTRVILRFLQIAFSEREKGDYRWVGSPDGGEDEALTEVTITDESPIANTRIEAMPCIVTQRSEVGFANLTMDGVSNLRIRTGEKETRDIIPGAMFIHTIARNRVEASRLGWTVMTLLRRYRAVLAKGTGFTSVGRGLAGEVLRLMPPTPPGSLVAPEPMPEMRAVTCICPFTFDWVETEIPLNAPKSRAMRLKLFGGHEDVEVVPE